MLISIRTLIDNIKKPTVTGIIVALVVQYLIVFLAYQWYNAVVNKSELTLITELSTVKNLIEKKLNRNAASLASVSLAIEHDGSVHDMDKVAKDVKYANPDINTIAILPGGIYQYFYPQTKSSADLMGFNLIKDGDPWSKKRIRDAINSRSAVFIGPFNNILNDSVVITMYPIFIDSKFWGLTLLTTSLKKILSGIDSTIAPGLNFTISNIDPTRNKEYVFYTRYKNFPGRETVSFKESFSHNSWKISGHYPKPGLLQFLVLPFFLSLLVALIVGAYVNNLIHAPRELKNKVRETEYELEKYDLRFKSIYENAPIGIAQINFKTRKINAVNERFCNIVGCDIDEVLSRGLWEFLPKQFYEDSYQEFQDVISGKEEQIQKYFKYNSDSGNEIWVHATLKPIRTHGGKIENHLLVVEDVTDTELAKRALEASEIQYRNLFDNSPIALSEYDHSGVKEYLIENGLMNKSYDELYEFFTNNTAELKACNDRIKRLIVNAKGAEIFGFDNVEEFLDAHQYILYAPHSWKLAIATFAAISNGEREIRLEEKVATKNYEEKYINYHWAALPGHEEKFDRVIVTMTDITDIKKSEQALLSAKKTISDSEKKFRSLFEDSPIALWEEDFSGLQAYFFEKGLMNNTFQELYNYFSQTKGAFEECFKLFRIVSFNKESVNLYDALSKAELLKNIKFLLSSPHSMHYTILALTALSNSILSSRYQTSINTISGKIKYIDYQWNVMPGHEHDFSRVIVAMIDITQQKEAELKAFEASENLRVSQERFRSLFYDSPIALWEEDYSEVKSYMSNLGIWGKSQQEIKEYFRNNPERLTECISKIKILSVNREALSIYNTSSVELLREYFMSAAHQPESRDVFLMQFAGLGAGKLKLRNESNSVNNEGEMISLDLNWNVLPGYEDTLERVIVSTNDITQIKKSESELRKAKEDLEQSLNIVSEQNKQLMQFSYIVSHNLRSHAANMQSLSELIIDPDTTSDEKIEYASHLHNITKMLSDTMEGLNEVTQIQTSGNLSIKPLNLKAFVRKTIDILSNKINEKQAIIHTEIGDNVTISYYQPYLESILLGFISNAIKYSSPKRQPIINIKYVEENGQKILTIQDNGIGIDLEKHGPRMFGLFKTFTSNPDSRGIGLYIAKHQIEAMRGQVTVESTPDVGTTFKIVFR